MKRVNFLSLAVILTALLFVACDPDKETEKKTGPNNFLSISDIHFNPLYDPTLAKKLIATDASGWDAIFKTSQIKPYGYYGWSGEFFDTGWKLFKSALTEMKSVNGNPDFITINGDFLAHSFESNFYQHADTTGKGEKANRAALHDFTIKTMDYIVNSIEASFPGATLFPTLGNNDSFCGDYEISINGSFLSRTAPIWEKHLGQLINKDSFNTSYKAGGYFVANSPVNPKHKIISLNTVMLSINYMLKENFCGEVIDPMKNRANAKAQFIWLENQLKAAKHNGETVWLMYHIPPGQNAYTSYKALNPNDCSSSQPANYYGGNYNETYLDIINRYQSVIAAQLGGHTHMDNFIVINGDKTPESFVHISPAISPVYWNNPGFLEYSYDKSNAVLKDYTVYGFNDVETATTPNWKPEYTFSSTYNQTELTPQSLKAVYKSFETDMVARQRYIDYYVVEDSANISIDPANWYNYYCAFGNQTDKEYQDCVCNKGK